METALPEISRAALASALGYISIGFWLFAQAPQVVKNARLRSCEGLALPFLCNWLFGDITNLLGCILTDQLPFQTYLAAYFCVIDFTLVGQFFYYRPSHPPTIYRSTSHFTSSPHQSLLIHTAPIAPHGRSRSQLTAHPQAHNRTKSSGSVAQHRPLTSLSASTSSTVRPGLIRAHTDHTTAEASTSAQSSIYRERGGSSHDLTERERDGSYQAIYEAALDVARAAERAEYNRQQSHSRSRTRRSRNPSGRPSVNSVMPDLDENTTSPVLGSRSAMFDSFHSDMSALTDTSGSSSPAIQPIGVNGQHLTTTPSSSPLLSRGRSLVRTATVQTPQEGEEGEDIISGLPGDGGRGVVQMRETGSRSKSRSVSMARGSSGRGSGRRAAGVAFMSFGMLAGWGGLGRGARIRHTTGPNQHRGVVLSTPSSDLNVPVVSPIHPLTILPSTLPTSIHTPKYDTSYILVDYPKIHDHPPPPVDEPPDYKRMVGRISAWACTTLYLTSRLPQIWKNFERKSVEGLSILLFLFAFCGNTAYVASILYNPAVDLPDSSQYLLEALPYLLGSGGTLLFDLTIILQSLMYGSAPPVPQTTLERSSFRKPLFRRRLRLAEEGRAVSASVHGPGAFGERQPLLSASVLTIGVGRKSHSTRHQDGNTVARPRSVSADGHSGDGGTWRQEGGFAGVKRVEVTDRPPEGQEETHLDD